MSASGPRYMDLPWIRGARELLGGVGPPFHSFEVWSHTPLSGATPEAGAWDLSEREVRLLAAMAAAARAAGSMAPTAPTRGGEPPQASDEFSRFKKAVDGAATKAAEAVLDGSRERIEIRAGEGARDESPGAFLGQTFGPPGPARHAVIDYVDGTALVAAGLPNALALGAIGEDVALTPDAKVFTALAPRRVLDNIDLAESPREVARQTVREVRRGLKDSRRPLRVLTHTPDAGAPQSSWYEFLGRLGVDLEVPSPVAVEPPYVLSLAREEKPAIDCMVGVMGLVELVYASMLLDLLYADYSFKFRLVGATSAKDLLTRPPNAYHLSAKDVAVARTGLLREGTAYTSDDFVRPGATTLAVLFAVTEAPLLALPAAEPKRVSGLAIARGGLLGVTITYHGDHDDPGLA